MGAVIGPDELRAQTWNSLAELIGKSILWGSSEAVELMGQLKPDRGPGPDD